MINIIILIVAATGLIFLYFQWRINVQQEKWIKEEILSLRQIQEQNRIFLTSELFNLQPQNLLTNPDPKPALLEQRKQLLSGETSRRKRKIKAYHLI